MRLNLALLGLPLLLGACGVPPAISAASWALDGVSYLVSGKSVTDHAISQVASQDCALLRIVQGRELCEDYVIDGDGPLVMVAAAPSGDNWLNGDDIEALEDPFVVPIEVAGFVQGFGPGTVAVEANAPVASFVSAPALLTAVDEARFVTAAPKARPAYPTPPIYNVAMPQTDQPEADNRPLGAGQHPVSVVGSFQSISNAWKQADRFASLGAQVRSMRVDGRTWHRVIVDAPLATVQNMGARDAWILKICDIDGRIPPCGPTTVSSVGVVQPQLAYADLAVN